MTATAAESRNQDLPSPDGVTVQVDQHQQEQQFGVAAEGKVAEEDDSNTDCTDEESGEEEEEESVSDGPNNYVERTNVTLQDAHGQTGVYSGRHCVLVMDNEDQDSGEVETPATTQPPTTLLPDGHGTTN